MFGLLHENIQPDGKIRADHVHQSESRDDPMTVHFHLLKYNRKIDNYFRCALWFLPVSIQTINRCFGFTFKIEVLFKKNIFTLLQS